MIWPIKARVTAATSARTENCQRALPQIEMSGPFSSVERMYKHKSTVCPAPAFYLFKPMHHKQTEKKHTLLQTFFFFACLLLANHAADTWTFYSPKHRYLRTCKKSDNWKHKTNWSRRLKKSDRRHAEKPGSKHTINKSKWQGQHRLLTDAGCSWLHQYPFSLLIDWGRAWQRGICCTSGCRWSCFILDHAAAERRVQN